MTSDGQLETEQKYDAETSTPLPELVEIPGVEHVAVPVSDHLEAVYFDTRTLTLAARRMTLRRRTGGADYGWHLKLPAGTDRRKELHAPLGQPDTVPDELTDHVHVYTRVEDLVPVARLTTQRTTHRLYGPGGEHWPISPTTGCTPKLCNRPDRQQWREWEIELVHGDRPSLRGVRKKPSPHGRGPFGAARQSGPGTWRGLAARTSTRGPESPGRRDRRRRRDRIVWAIGSRNSSPMIRACAGDAGRGSPDEIRDPPNPLRPDHIPRTLRQIRGPASSQAN